MAALAAVVGLGAVSGLGARAAAAQPARPGKTPKAVKACGVTAIPLVVGNEWTYEPVAPPADRALNDQQTKLTPVRPEKIDVKVTAIDTKDGVTTVTLHETIDDKEHDTSITCTPGGARFQIAMDAFWFAGEPGTTVGIELDDVQRKGQTLTLAGGKISSAVSDWHDDITASWKHTPVGKSVPTMHHGTMTLERHWVPQPDEPIATKFGSWQKTKKLGLETIVNVVMDPPLVPAPPPEPPPPAPGAPPPEPPKPAVVGRFPVENSLVNFIWIADGVGPVQLLNSYGQMFQLSSATLAP
ncbi:MAG TPA: hypothetical protein VHE35_01900 [Kofleriaceae bacterium]|nr:hypothetical protein [Kofleriaceae bacterium]